MIAGKRFSYARNNTGSYIVMKPLLKRPCPCSYTENISLYQRFFQSLTHKSIRINTIKLLYRFHSLAY